MRETGQNPDEFGLNELTAPLYLATGESPVDVREPRSVQPQPIPEPAPPEKRIRVRIPGVGIIRFPGHMGIEDINRAIETEILPGRVGRAQTAVSQFARGATEVVAGIPKALAIGNAEQYGKALDYFNRIDNGEDVGRLVKDTLDPDVPYLLAKEYQNSPPDRRNQLKDMAWQRYSEVRASPYYKAGESLEKAVEDVTPVNPWFEKEFFTGKVTRGLGSFGGFTATSFLGRPIGLGKFGGVAASGAALGAVESFEDALDSGADIEQAFQSSQFGGVVGISEALPISRMLNRLDRGTGGKIKRAIIDGLKEGTEEALQEAFQTVTRNMVASDIVKYDAERDWWAGAGEGAAVGFTTGDIYGFLATLMFGRRAAGRMPSTPPPAAAGSRPAPPAATTTTAMPPSTPTAPAPTPGAPMTPPQPATTSTIPGLETLMEDERPIEEIRAEEEGRDRAEIEAARTRIIERRGWPEMGARVTVTLPDGETITGRLDDAFAVDTLDGMRIVQDNGEAAEFFADDIVSITRGEGTQESPVDVQTGADVDIAAQNTDPAPTPAQKDAENYQMGHIRWQGLDISIETAKGGTRTAKDGSWSVEDFPAHYGRIKGTTGKDGDHVDVFIGDSPESPTVWVIDQIRPEDSKFDEHKALIGFTDRETALFTYSGGFTDGTGPDRIGAVTEMNVEQFKGWLANGNLKKPLRYETRPLKPVVTTPPQGASTKGLDDVASGLTALFGENIPTVEQAPGSAEPVEPPTQPPAAGAEPSTPSPGATLSDEDAGRLFDEAQSLMRRLPQNIGKVKQEGKLSPAQLKHLARLDEIEAVLPSTGAQWQRIWKKRRDEWENRAAKNAADRRKHSEAASEIPVDRWVKEIVAAFHAGGIEAANQKFVEVAERENLKRFEHAALQDKALVALRDAGWDGKRAASKRPPQEPEKKPTEAEDKTDYGTASNPNVVRLGQAFAAHFAKGKGFATIRHAQQFAAEKVGGAIVSGTPAVKKVDEAIEFGAVLAARRIVEETGGGPKRIFDRLVDLYQRMPRLSSRTSTSIAQQAYSTPLPIAFLASHLAGVTSGKTVLEPTAGNGALLIAANPKNVIANEIDGQRATNLTAQGFQTVTGGDASEPRSFEADKVDVVIANPPFGVVKDDDGMTKEFVMAIPAGARKALNLGAREIYLTSEIDHAIALNALAAMKDDGSAVLIVGGLNKLAKTQEARSDAYNGKAKRQFYLSLYKGYNVVDHFTVSGDLYERQGAGWPIDVIVIRGRGESARKVPAADVPRMIATFEELKELFDVQYHGKVREAAGDGDRGGAEPGGGDGRRGEGAEKPRPPRVPSPQGKPVGVRDGRGGGQSSDERLPEPERGPTEEPRPPKSGEPSGKPGGVDDIEGIFDEELEAAFPGERKPPPPPKQETPKPPPSGGGPAGGTLITRVKYPTTPTPQPQKLPTAEQKPRTPGETAKSAAKETVKGLDDVASGLTKLFGADDPTRLGMGPSFDQETYEKAKPLFIEGVKHFQKAGQDVRETMRLLIAALRDKYNFTREMIERMKPYIVQFIRDVQAGVIQLGEKKAETAETKKKKEEDAEPKQVPYKKKSALTGMGTLVPTNMQTSIEDSLNALEKKVGNIDDYVADRLGYSRKEMEKYFAAEQVDAIALGIANVEKDAGFIIGDQTGIGKGRVVAAMLRYAMKNGLNPVFVTRDPNLYADMFRDLRDIGMEKTRILPTNGNLQLALDEDGDVVLNTPGSGTWNQELLNIARKGLQDSGYDVIFTTYSQMQNVRGNRTPRQQFLDRMTTNHRGFIVFDESHNAGGSGEDLVALAEAGEMNRALFARLIARGAKGVFYSSATYAKRPEVMDLYFKTDMRLAVDNMAGLATAIKKGGIPMQQVVAAMLAKAGQYMRRERTFGGVSYDAKIVDVDRDGYGRYSNFLRQIYVFSEKYVKPAIKKIDDDAKAGGKAASSDGSTGGAGANSTAFGSIMHNLINQMLLAIKAPAAVKEAIAAIKRGEKPVLTVSNTLGKFIEDYAADVGISPGDAMGVRFNDLLDRYLDRCRVYTVRRPFMRKGEKAERRYLTDEELGPEGVAFFKMVRESIAKVNLGDMPISPIDYMKNELAKAGYKVGEITGRKATIAYTTEGRGVYRVRPPSEIKTAARRKTIRDFNQGDINAIVINQAGSTGISIHASETYKDKSRRHMIIVQAEANIDTHMQMLGRIHRTGQVITPVYTQMVANIPAEKRPAAVLAKKMASLNANTTAARESVLKAEDVPDFLNEYGDRAAVQVMLDNPDIYHALGNPIAPAAKSYEREDAMRKVTGHIPLLPLADQETVYDMLESIYTAMVEEAEASGESVLEAKFVDLEARTLHSETLTEPKNRRDPSPFEEGSFFEIIDAKVTVKPYSTAEVLAAVAKSLNAEVREGEKPTEALKRLAAVKNPDHITNAESEFADYRRSVLDEIADPSKLRGQEVRLDGIFETWSSLIREMPIGTPVKLATATEILYGVVTNVRRRGKAKNPLALGTWAMTIALVNGEAKQMTLPFSRLALEHSASDEEMSDEDTIVISFSSRIRDMNVIEAFDILKGSQHRVQRIVVTGNLLSGFDAVKGKGIIINFTDDEGRIRQGIRMPKDFKLKDFREEKPLVFNDVSSAVRFVEQGGKLDTSDGFIHISTTYNQYGAGTVRIEASSARAKGGRYYLNRKIIAAVGGQDFVKQGNAMATSFPIERLELVINEVKPLASLVAAPGADNRELARQILGIEDEAEPPPEVNQGEPGGRFSIGSGKNPGRFAAAWHGSPYDFDAFSTGKIGTGEGATAYGWGLYFASKKEIAEWYRNKLGGGIIAKFRGKTLEDMRREVPSKYKDYAVLSDYNRMVDALYEVEAAGNIEDAKKSLESQLDVEASERSDLRAEGLGEDWEPSDPLYDHSEIEEALAWLEANEREITIEKPGRLYKVDIAPAEDEYLLWDEPLSGQSEKIRRILRDIALGHPESHAHQTGEQLYKAAVNEYGGKEEASIALKENGIRGIKYLDASSRDTGGTDYSYNYVIFDEADISILGKMERQRRKADPRGRRTSLLGESVLRRRDSNVLLYFTEEFDRAKIVVFNSLRQELDRMGLEDVALRMPQMMQSDDKNPKRRFWASGHYFNGLIDVAYRSQDKRKTLSHEVIHALRDLGLFTKAEWQTLVEAARKMWRKQYNIDGYYYHLIPYGQEYLDEEAIATAYGEYMAGNVQAGGRILRAFNKIRNFFRALLSALQGNGFHTWESVFARIEKGEVGRRHRTVHFTDHMSAEGFEKALHDTFGKHADMAKMEIELTRKARADIRHLTKPFDKGPPGRFSIQPEMGEGANGRIIIEERKDAGDLNPIKRYFYTPQAAFRRWPSLAALQRFGVRVEMQMSKFNRRLNHDYDGIRAGLTREEFEQLSDILFLGDSDQKEFTADELTEMGANEAVVKAYAETRTLFDKLGRFVDMHRRSMMPTIRRRKYAILNRMARIRNMADPEFRRLYNQRGRLRSKLRRGEGNPEAISKRLDAIERIMNIKRQETDEYQELVREIDRIDAVLAQTSIRRRAAYVPHKFFGSWAVYELVEGKDEDGNPVINRRLVAGEHGFFPDRESAVKGAKAYLTENANAQLLVRPVQFNFPYSEATALTDASYWRFVQRVGDALSIEGPELKDLIRGVARRPFRRRIAGFTQFRKGVPGYSEDFDRVMQAHIGEVVRYVMLDKLKYRAINTMERMGLSPHRSASQERDVLRSAVLAWFRDVNGQKQPFESQIDELLEKPWAKPVRMALMSGTAVAGMTVFGVSANPMVGALLGSYVGYRVYRALHNAGAFKSRAITGAMLGDMAHLKLGSFFNIFSPIVNLTQTIINTFPVLKEYTFTGIRLLNGAAMSRFAGKPNRYWRLLERADIVTQYRYTEQPTGQFAKESRIAYASLFLFNKVEQFNRAVSFLGGYQRAIDRGASEADAVAAGEKSMLRTQFHYGAAAKPEVLRNIFLRVPGQFKNFLMQQIGFIAGLDPKKELPLFLVSLFLIAGSLGLPGIDLIDILLGWFADFSPINEIKRYAIKAQAEGKLWGTVGNFVARGLPGIFGEDLSARAGVGDKFLPLEMRDFAGPWVSTFESAIRLGELNATIADHARNVSTGIGRPLKSLEAAANGLPLDEAVLHPKKFYEALADGKIAYSNPWKGGALEYDETILSNADLVRMAMGGTPMEVAQLRDVEAIQQHDEAIYRERTKRLLNRVVNAYRRYGDAGSIEKLNEVLENVKVEADRQNIAISRQQVKTAIEAAFTPRVLRTVERTRRQLRPEIWGLAEKAAEGFGREGKEH